MKVIAFLFASILAVAVKDSRANEAYEMLRTFSTECFKEIGVPEAAFDEMIKNLPATNMDVKCLRACVMKKITVINSDGKPNTETAIKIAEMHTEGDADKMKLAMTIIDTCGSMAFPDDHCESAEQYKMCILSESKKQGIGVM